MSISGRIIWVVHHVVCRPGRMHHHGVWHGVSKCSTCRGMVCTKKAGTRGRASGTHDAAGAGRAAAPHAPRSPRTGAQAVIESWEPNIGGAGRKAIWKSSCDCALAYLWKPSGHCALAVGCVRLCRQQRHPAVSLQRDT